MFATPTSYAVTPSRKPFMRIPERASTFLRDVKRRSQRVKRSKSLIARNPDSRLSGSFVQLNEEEVRQKYIEDVKREKEWKSGVSGDQELLHSTLELQCTCACRLHQAHTPLHSNLSNPLHPRQLPFLPPSPASTIYTPRQSAKDLTLDQTPRPVRFDLSPRSSGQFRKLSSPNLTELEDKENLAPPSTPVFSSTRRQCSRRSSLFTPSFKKLSHVTDEVTPYRKPTVRPVLVESKKVKKLGEETGQGRIIPLKQGYLYKKSGSSRMFRRKYVTLCSDGTMTYYPSFQAYVDNLHGKEIHLQHVTVKIPGQKPTGLKSTGVGATDKLPDHLGSSSSDEFDKETVTYEACEKKPDSKTPKRKRHRLSDEQESSLFELVIVSLDSRQWQFQVCSQEEGEEWVTAIQQQIHVSLRGSSAWKTQNSETDCLRAIPGNDTCADCGMENPAWASLNLGTLICIECSGIHRNLGTHISKVRSLDLDSWSETNLVLMRSIGNNLSNLVWEHALRSGNSSSSSLEFWNKPGPQSSREDKENFIKSKYLSKNFICETVVSSQDLVTAVERSNMSEFLELLVNVSSHELNSCHNTYHCSPLQLAIKNNNISFAQLLVWNNSGAGLGRSEDGCFDASTLLPPTLPTSLLPTLPPTLLPTLPPSLPVLRPVSMKSSAPRESQLL